MKKLTPMSRAWSLPSTTWTRVDLAYSLTTLISDSLTFYWSVTNSKYAVLSHYQHFLQFQSLHRIAIHDVHLSSRIQQSLCSYPFYLCTNCCRVFSPSRSIFCSVDVVSSFMLRLIWTARTIGSQFASFPLLLASDLHMLSIHRNRFILTPGYSNLSFFLTNYFFLM